MRLLFIIGLLFIVGSDGFFWVGRSSRRARQRAAQKLAAHQRAAHRRTLSNHTLSNSTLSYTLSNAPRSERMLTDNLFLKNVANYSH